jgi:hypothetical protein
MEIKVTEIISGKKLREEMTNFLADPKEFYSLELVGDFVIIGPVRVLENIKLKRE